MKIKYVVFDVDGTLIDTEAAILGSLRRALAEATGRQYTGEELVFVLGIPGDVALARLGVADVEAVTRLWYTYYGALAGDVRVYPGVKPLLEWLKGRGYHTGIVTSKTRAEYNADFLRFGLQGYFDVVRCAGDTPRGKPYPDPLVSYCELAGAAPGEVLYIGDSWYDMQCAGAAGTKRGLALWGAHERHEADFYFESPEAVQPVLQAL